jgi:hypothetical protein
MKMLQDMKEENGTLKRTFSASIRPLLDAKVIQMRRGENHLSPPREIDIEIENNGKGTARNIEINCECSAREVQYTLAQLPFLEVGNNWRISLNRVFDNPETGAKALFLLISVMYNDELGELWATTLRIVNDNGGWIPEVATSNTARKHD